MAVPRNRYQMQEKTQDVPTTQRNLRLSLSVPLAAKHVFHTQHVQLAAYMASIQSQKQA